MVVKISFHVYEDNTEKLLASFWEALSEPCQTSKMESFAEIVNSLKL